MYNITFNGVTQPDFVRIRQVDMTALPDVQHEFKRNVGAIGLFEAGTSLGGKLIKVKIQIVPTAPYFLTIPSMTRELAKWLRGDDFKLSTLYLGDETQYYYKAKVNSAVSITDLLFLGEGEIEFIVPSGLSHYYQLLNGTRDIANHKFTLTYTGTAPTYPFITFNPHTSFNNAELTLWCVETADTITINPTNYVSYVNYYVDCAKRKISSTGSDSLFNMSHIDITTTRWLTFPKEGTYNVVYNITSEADWSLTCPINYL